jgi:hypothetical protein
MQFDFMLLPYFPSGRNDSRIKRFFSSFLPQQGVPSTFQGRNDVRIPKTARDV